MFRGLAPGEIRPGLVQVQVVNGTIADPAQQREGTLATDVSGALQQVGFEMASPDDADTLYAQTTIEFAPGQQAYAERVARHVTMAAPIPTVENPDLTAGSVRLVAGLDFTTVHQDATPIEAMPGAGRRAGRPRGRCRDAAGHAAAAPTPRRCPRSRRTAARSSSASRPRAPPADRRRRRRASPDRSR